MKLINGLYELTPEEIKLLEKQEDTWPKIGDEYWYANGGGRINNASWEDVNFDKSALYIGNVFRTKEEAEAHVEYLKAVQIIKKDAKGFVPDWDNYGQRKYSGCYYKKFLYSLHSYENIGPAIYFATKQDIEDSFKNNKQAWMTYLGVKE